MDVLPWLVRHAGWLLEGYHVKGNKMTAFEDCFWKPYQGELMKFAEAALFRVAVTEAVKRVPDTEQKSGDLVKGLQETSVKQACTTPCGKTSQDSSSCNARCDASSGKGEDADVRRSAKAQDLDPPAVPLVIRVPQAADTENEPNSSSSRPMETEDGGARDNTASDRAQVRSPAPPQSNPMEQTGQSGGHSVKSVNQPEESVSSGVKRDARAAELPDEDEQGGKFQQVEGLTAVDAEELVVLNTKSDGTARRLHVDELCP